MGPPQETVSPGLVEGHPRRWAALVSLKGSGDGIGDIGGPSDGQKTCSVFFVLFFLHGA